MLYDVYIVCAILKTGLGALCCGLKNVFGTCRAVCLLDVLNDVDISCWCLVDFLRFTLTCHMMSTLYVLLCRLRTRKMEVLGCGLILWHVGQHVTWTC